MADASLVIIYLDDLLSPMVFSSMLFSSSLHSSPSKILCTLKRTEVNTANQLPDSAVIYSCWLDPLISIVLLMYGISTRQAPRSLLQTSMYPSQDAYYKVSWGNKRNFVLFDSIFFFTCLTWIFTLVMKVTFCFAWNALNNLPGSHRNKECHAWIII